MNKFSFFGKMVIYFLRRVLQLVFNKEEKEKDLVKRNLVSCSKVE